MSARVSATSALAVEPFIVLFCQSPFGNPIVPGFMSGFTWTGQWISPSALKIRAASSVERPRERTLRRWLADDEQFQTEHASALRTTFEAGIQRAQALAAKAVDTLEELLEDKTHPNVRLGAARTVAEIGIHQHDADSIMKKLEELEAHQARRS